MDENPRKEEGRNYECEYCNKKFKTSEGYKEHKLNCEKKSLKIKGRIKTEFGVAEGFKFGIGFWIASLLIGMITLFALAAFGITILRHTLG